MADEEKTVETETTEETSDEVTEENTDAEESSEEQAEETEASDTTKSETTDWKGKTDELKQKPTASEAYKQREQKREGEEISEEQREEERAKLKQEVGDELRKEIRQEQALEQAQRLAETDDEAQYLFERWKRKPFEVGTTVNQQMEEVYLLTHKDTLLGENQEMKRALAGKKRVNKTAAGDVSEETQSTGGEPKLETGDKQVLAESGFKYNAKTRRYEKKLPSGKTQYLDMETGKLSQPE